MTEGAVDTRDARTVVEWLTGRHVSFRRVLFGARGVSLDPAAAALGADDVLFAPVGVPVDTLARVIPYDGAFDDVGDVLHVAGHAVELQHYAAAAYVELLGPTAMRFLDADGWRAFLADADLARESGVFTAPLTDTRLRLADADVLRAPFDVAPPRALHLHADGRVTAGAQGAAVGGAADVGAVFAAPRPRWTALAGIVDPDELARGLVTRPWLGRFLGAASLAASLGDDAGEIDGFGWTAPSAPAGDAVVRVDDPFLVRTTGGVLLIDLRTRRRQRLADATVTVVSTLQSSSDSSRAAARLARARRLSLADARRLCAEATDVLGVRTGLPSSMNADAGNVIAPDARTTEAARPGGGMRQASAVVGGGE